MQEGCKKILVSDYFHLQKKLVAVRQQGTSISNEMVCGACHYKTIQAGKFQNCFLLGIINIIIVISIGLYTKTCFLKYLFISRLIQSHQFSNVQLQTCISREMSTKRHHKVRGMLPDRKTQLNQVSSKNFIGIYQNISLSSPSFSLSSSNSLKYGIWGNLYGSKFIK